MKGGKRNNSILQWLSVFVALVIVCRPSVASELPPPEELRALTDFAKANMNAEVLKAGNWNISWDSNGNWTGSNPCKGWSGVVCWSKGKTSTKGTLMTLKLPQSTLQGSISPALGNLSFVNSLNLAENKLSGDIGLILANLTGMTRLDLQGNNFTGLLSRDWIQNEIRLEELLLARNSFVGIVPTGVFANLHNLTSVDISNNSLSGPIPDDLVRNPSLQKLLLAGNNFSETLPDFLRNSQSLQTVDFSSNALTGNLPTVWNMPNLTSLDLSGNDLSGPIPDGLLSRTNLSLNLAKNNFSGIVSVASSRKFGCAAFASNPGLVMQDPTCNVEQPAGNPPSVSPGLPPRPAAVPDKQSSKKSIGLSTITIVALILGNIVLILMSLIGFVLLYMWWKRSTGRLKSEYGDDTQQTVSNGNLRHSSKDTSISSAEPVYEACRRGPEPINVSPKSNFSSKADVQPRLKSIVGMVPESANDSVNTDKSLAQSFSADFGASIATLDTTLALDFENVLSAKASILGAGSFGVMYMACLETGQVLAIKRIEELALADQLAFGKQCTRLAEALHPNLLQLRAYCWSPQVKLLIYDHMKNGSVHSLLHEGRGSSSTSSPRKAINWATRLKIAVGTARALAHLHDSDMVHGNIKASNVLLDEQFEPRVSDFGLETLLQTPLQQHTVSTNAGYLAPELVTSATHRRTQDGDVYSLGVLLLELLTGKEPKDNTEGSLPELVQEMTSANRTVELFDPALVAMHLLPAQDILEFLKLAQACASQDSTARPSITIVLRSLESIVPGSTAPRSCNVDTDAFSPEFNKFFIPVMDYDDAGSFCDTTENPLSPGFVRRENSNPQQKSKDVCSNMLQASPLSSGRSFYSSISTPSISSSPDVAVEGPFRFSL